MDLEEARRIIGVLINDFGTEKEGEAWDRILKEFGDPGISPRDLGKAGKGEETKDAKRFEKIREWLNDMDRSIRGEMADHCYSTAEDLAAISDLLDLLDDKEGKK